MPLPPGNPQQDRNLGLVSERLPDGRKVTFFNEDLALQICERLAAGELLRDICTDPSMPAISTFRRWVVLSPPLNRALMAARELSAQSLEEEALHMARSIRDTPDNGTKVRAFDVAMNQLRWSATRRDPGRFGERAQASLIVPIQINTSLDLGVDSAEHTADFPNIYTLEATVIPNGNAATPQDPGEETLLTAKRKRLKSLEKKPILRQQVKVKKPSSYDPTAPRKKVLTPRTPAPASEPEANG